MSIKEITYSTPQWYLGRNGTANSTGLELMLLRTYPSGDHVTLTPLNKKDGSPGRCQINIPTQDIPDLIKTLQVLFEASQGHKGHVKTLLHKIEEYLRLDYSLDEQDSPPPAFPTVEGGRIKTSRLDGPCLFLLEEDEEGGGVLVSLLSETGEFLESVLIADLLEAEAEQILNDPVIKEFFKNIN